ncbi:MAG: hypothetical protein GC160_18660 [Acidobacteria bacterium]|nr:hypothetical protein [Acidobacteriota bacterium]
MATAVSRLTLAEFMALPDTEMRQELDEGVLLETPPAKKLHSEILHRILFALYEAAKTQPKLRVRAALACQLSWDPPTVRIADVAVLTAEQLANADERGYVQGAPSLAIEIISPSESVADLVKKTKQYLESGAGRVWTVYPDSREIHVHRKGASIEVLSANAELTLPDMLPDWVRPVSTLLD